VGDREESWRRLGDFIKSQRQLHELSLRQLAEAAKVSNPYLSQLERGMYKPSVDVLRNIASALRVSTETMLTQAGLLGESGPAPGTGVEAAIRVDPMLTTEQKEAMLGVYRGFLAAPSPAPKAPARRRATAAPRRPPARKRSTT
jgi:transcriptional regulator with XRE-family HTH domain